MSLNNADPKVTEYIESSEDFAKPILSRYARYRRRANAGSCHKPQAERRLGCSTRNRILGYLLPHSLH